MVKHLNIRISGGVQGVFFRASTCEKAQEFNIKGFVRNESDGSIYIEAEGEEKKLTQFLNWCHRGSPLARVDKVETHEATLKSFLEFTTS